MQSGHLTGCLAWLALAGGYAATVCRLGRVGKEPPAPVRGGRPLLKLVRPANRFSPPRLTAPRRIMSSRAGS